MRPKSEIYTPKQDDEHPHLFHMGSSPPKGQCSVLTNGPCPMFGHKRQVGGGWGLRAEGLKQEERTSLHRIMR